MQWEERCRYAVSRIAVRFAIFAIAFFVAFMGESVTVSAQDVVSSVGDLSDECKSDPTDPNDLGVIRESNTLSSIIGFVFGVAVFLIILSVLGTLAMQNDKNIYYKSGTRFDHKDAS
jgi:hypothetical protein